jgi:hypothetical protein
MKAYVECVSRHWPNTWHREAFDLKVGSFNSTHDHVFGRVAGGGGGGGRSTPGAARRRASPTFPGHQQKRTLPIERAAGCQDLGREEEEIFTDPTRREGTFSFLFISQLHAAAGWREGQGLHFWLLLLQTPATLDQPVLGGRTLTHVDPRTCHLFSPFHPLNALASHASPSLGCN